MDQDNFDAGPQEWPNRVILTKKACLIEPTTMVCFQVFQPHQFQTPTTAGESGFEECARSLEDACKGFTCVP